MKKLILISLSCVLFAFCTTQKNATKSDRYPGMYQQRPTSILVMPPINKSTKVEAKELFYSSLIVPISLKGYYVLPPLLTMEILKEESAYDAEMFENSSMKPIGNLFGVDAVLFTTIHDWAKTTIASQIKVTVEYSLKSTKTDEILFRRKGTIVYAPQSSSGNGLVDILSTVVTTALTKEIVVGRKCSVYTLSDIPAGKYSPSWEQDGSEAAGDPEFRATVR